MPPKIHAIPTEVNKFGADSIASIITFWSPFLFSESKTATKMAIDTVAQKAPAEGVYPAKRKYIIRTTGTNK